MRIMLTGYGGVHHHAKIMILISFAQLQRLPVSFHQLKELRWLDLKNNPLVSALAEAAGDCLDQKGCQEAAKKVVKLMTVVHAELEKKRLKELEEIKSKYFSTRLSAMYKLLGHRVQQHSS